MDDYVMARMVWAFLYLREPNSSPC
jgi:hypothetical protein